MITPQNNSSQVEGTISSLDDVTGEVRQCPQRFDLLPILTPGDPFDEVLVTAAANANGNTHAVRHARRGCHTTRWLFNGADWVRRVDAGQSFGDNERIAENRGTGQEIEHNPTMGGAILKPDGADQLKIYPSVPLHFRTEANGREVTVEGAVLPMEFDSYGVEVSTHASKLGGPDTPGIWWRMRQFQRTQINYFGRSDVHRHFFASYFPRTVNDRKTTMRSLLVSSIWPIDFFGTGDADCIYYAPQDGTSFSCRTGDVNDWITATAPNTRVNWNLTRPSGLSGDVNPALTYTTGRLWNDRGHAAVILKSDSARFDMVCAIVVGNRLRDETQEGRFVTELGASQIRTNTVTPGVDSNSGQRISLRAASLKGRRPGWIGVEWWAVTGVTVAEVKARIDELSRSGLLDQRLPMETIPAHVLAGTDPPAS